MASAAETLAAWVEASLAGLPATVRRGGVLAEDIEAGALVSVVETAAEEIAELVGGAREMLLEIDVEIAVAEADDAARAAAFDALAAQAAAALVAAARPAALDHLRINPLRERQDIAQPGARTIRVATLPVELHYETGPNPMEDI